MPKTKLNTLPRTTMLHDGVVPPTKFGGGVLVFAPEQSRVSAAYIGIWLERLLERVNPNSLCWDAAEAWRRGHAKRN